MTARHRRLSRACVSGLAFVLLVTACGLKDETYQSLQSTGGGGGTGVGNNDGTGNGTDGTNTDGTGSNPDGTGTNPDGTGTNTGGNNGSGTGSNPNAPGGSLPPGQSPPPGQQGPSGPGTTVGVTKDKITIGIHAPLTGASPLPQASFERGARNYWIGKKIFGRSVELFVMDDTYKPSGAIRACQELARKHFIVVGGAGADQIQACGKDRTLARAHTPYISAGVTENGLHGVPTYFAASLTYKEQAPLVIKMAEQQNFLRKGRWAVVTSDTPNFKDARDAMTAELAKKGIDFKVHLVPKAGSDSDALRLSNDLRGGAYPVIYFLGQPTFFLKVVRQTQNVTYQPVWTGVGVSMGVNTVAQVACEGTRESGGYNGHFLSPYPGLDRAPKAFWDSDNGRSNKDDIELTLWGFSEYLEKALLLTGGNLTRENFMAQLEKATISSGTFPGVRYSPSDHFGGTAAYSLKSDCTKNQYVTSGGPLS